MANAATANLSGNLFQANVSDGVGGAIVAAEDMQRWLQSQGFDPATRKPAQFADYIRDEILKWGGVVKASDVQPE